jgi:glycosyltransferase involved in cell wall biosynthesis
VILVENLPVPFDRRVWQEALALRAKGYRVHVVCPSSPDFDRRHEILDGVTVHRYRPLYEAKSILGYALEYGVALLSMVVIVANIARHQRIDVIQACNPPDLLFLVAVPFVLFGGSRFVFDHHDACPELMEAKGHTPESIAVRLSYLLERVTFRLASVSIATNESYKQIAIDRGHMEPKDVFVVRSAPTLERFARARPSRRLHFDHAYLVAYVGVMGIQDGVDNLIDAAGHLVEELGHTDVQFTLAGADTEFDRLSERVRELGLGKHVCLLGRVSDDELGELLASADVCINPDVYDRMNDISTMNKIMEYMALSKPIVQFDFAEGRVSAGDASLYVERNDARALAKGIAELLHDEPRRARMGEIGRQRLEHELAWEYQVPTLLAAYASALASRRPSTRRAGVGSSA